MKQLTIILLMITAILFLQFQTQARSVCATDVIHQQELNKDPTFGRGVHESNCLWLAPGRLMY